MAGAASSSSSSSSENYDVFLSFRGEDTRRNFVSHLYKDLLQKQIKTYKDDKTLEKGDEVWPALVRAIKNSYICIVVFSKDYASSTWCLKELTQILDCKQEGEIIPVFYEIEPTHVRHQTESYQKAFEKHEKELDEKTVAEWKASLKKAANFSGWDSQSKDYSDESNFIDEIVKKVLRKLGCKYPPNELPGLIGIEENIRSIESLLQKVQTIGIWGMGGIGKTTLARAVFDKLSRQYDGRCFLANAREESGKHGPGDLRKHLLSKLLDEKDIPEEETSFAMSRLKRKKVFIVLDDVDDPEQLQDLIGDYDCLRSDSRLIVTTRNKHVLTIISEGGKEIYKVHTLQFRESIELFSMNAFKHNHPKIGFEELTRKAVAYAGGIPLALKILGSSLCSRGREVWESALKKLESRPNMKIQDVLRWSYNRLEDTEKQIFLDIACFFKGEHKSKVIRTLDACDFFATAGIETLLDRALIAIDYGGCIEMHDLIEEMGKQIVREEGKCKRLWNPQEFYDVLQHKECHFIEGIILCMSEIRDLLSADTFTRMRNLRILKIYTSWGERSCKEYLPSHLELNFHKLRYFRWEEFPLQSLPSIVCFEKLVEFHMPNSHVEKLWDGVLDTMNLRIINLWGSKNLIELPNLSNSSNLEEIDLSYCENLHCVDLSISCLKHLCVIGCSSLKEFSLISEEIMELDLRTTSIEILTSSIGRCSKLKDLYLPDTLKNLPNELSNLRSFQKLVLGNCSELDTGNLHIILDGLQCLEHLTLSSCLKLESLLSETTLKSLRELNVQECSSLKEFSLSSEELMELDLRDTRIEILSSSIGRCSKLKYLYLPNSLKNLPNELSNLRSLQTLVLHNCRELDTGNMHIILDGLQSLKELDLSNCKKVESLLSETTLKSLKELNVQGCSNLKEFSLSSEELIELDLRGTRIEILSLSIGRCSKLKYLYLPYSLKNLPNELSNLRSLRKLVLGNCSELDTGNLHIILDGLQSLEELKLRGCLKLESLLCETTLKSLKQFNAQGCSSLKEFSLSSEELLELDLRDTEIEILSSSIGRCSKLKYLYLPNSLKNLPNELSNLISLQKLVLGNCSELDTGNLHIILDGLQSLKELDLRGCLKLESLLSETTLKSLKQLNVQGCSSLKEFSLSSEELLELDLRDTKIEILSSSIGRFSKLKYLYLPNSLKNLPNELSNLISLQKLVLGNCSELDTGNLHIILDGLQSLKELDLRGCLKLESLLSETTLKSLKQLNVQGCSSLKEFSLSSKELMKLDLRDTRIEILSSSIGRCSKLKHLYLPYSLKNLPNELSNLISLQKLVLGNCRELDTRNLHVILDGLQSLKELDLRYCLKLESLLSKNTLKSLKQLNIQGCSSLKEFSLSSKELMELDLRDSRIEILASSIGRCRKLKYLYLPNSLKNLPNELSNLISLQKLMLGNCRELDTGNLHIILDGLQSLEALDLSGCCNLSHFLNVLHAFSRLEVLKLDGSSVESLPISIIHLPQLRTLSVQYCSRRRHLPALPPTIQLLKANNCTSLETLSASMELKVTSYQMDFLNCVKLDQDSFFYVQAYLDFIIKQKEASGFHFFFCLRFEACFPGNKIPRSFLHRETQRWITFEFPSYFNLRGFAFCIIISPDIMPPDSEGFIIDCECHFVNRKIVKFQHVHKPDPNEVNFDTNIVGMISEHIYIWYENYYFMGRPNKIEEKANIHYTNFNQKVFIEFSFYLTKGAKTMKMNQMIKECGVCPILNEKEHNFDLNMDIKIEGCWDINDQCRKKFKAFKLKLELGTKSYNNQNIDEFESSTIEIGVDGTGLDHVCPDELQMLDQRKELKEFIFEPLSANYCKQKSRKDLT